MTTGTAETDKVLEHDDDPLAASKKLLRDYAGAIIGTLILTAALVLVALVSVDKDGKAAFARTSSDLMRDRLSVQDHIAELGHLYWFPEQTTLIANLHDGTFDDTETITLSEAQVVGAGDILANGRPDEQVDGLVELGIDGRIAGFLARLQAAGGIHAAGAGLPAIPTEYHLTAVTQFAGMRIYAQDGLKTFERDLPVRATLISVIHPDYDPAPRVATIESITR